MCCPAFCSEKVNILTINSTIPTNGAALVTITAETMEMAMSLEELIQRLSDTKGVVKAEVVAG